MTKQPESFKNVVVKTYQNLSPEEREVIDLQVLLLVIRIKKINPKVVFGEIDAMVVIAKIGILMKRCEHGYPQSIEHVFTSQPEA